MHVFLYEWATGGGLVEAPGGLPTSMVREGAAMVTALAADLARIDGYRVTVLRDPRVLHLALPHCDIIDVISSSAHYDELERLATAADVTILIAPEFDGILLKTARTVGACGGKLLSPSREFIGVTANKQRTCELLAAAGVPVPDGRVVEPEEPLPHDFAYPAVIKPVDGAGSQDTYLVSSPYDATPPYAWPRRLERFMPGIPASVAVLCGPAGRLPLMPTKQRISDDGRLRYLGGELPLASGLAARATALAEQALAALPPAIGIVGVDLILGRDPIGSNDSVLEVNPRLTTSYVGLRAATADNLSEIMIKVALGSASQIAFSSRPLEFDREGNVSFMR